ncbi:glycine cleavage system aminomethyltransferase GcvT [Desulfuribacillus alkaliarsenatis]|uniref:Aminomethyltransferase n=1 Tax=Desulfuribacillus alkaliarsenatis TaxID=766136 RepID=A0A1E5G5N8_9FIRM|nr:glycine cleavage system aminomethyltransferase GcvT [Desulfuribacillus alkaliarsenatis]OEF98415.1 glycine cleavage system protein T [Desulfuribacillus alkaliarsenatis]
MQELRETPLFPIYKQYGAKVIDFGGWALPVQFQGIIEEHQQVREHAGLFDVSHMGQILVTGKDAERFLQYISTNDISKLTDNQAMYTFFCYEDGGTVDDLLIYRLSEERYMLVVNAANIEKDLEWLHKQHRADTWEVSINDISEETALLAIQGPKSLEILQPLANYDLAQIKRFRFVEQVNVAGVEALVSRTGYTGEDGFELYIAAKDAITLWEAILDAGKAHELAPIGLGARDTLRFEAKLPLYGQELNKDISPLEAGLDYFVKFDKGDFVGRGALLQQKQTGVERKLIGFEMVERGVPRAGYHVYNDGKQIGTVTTGSFSPTLKKNIGLALVGVHYADIGQELDIEIRNKYVKARIIETPFLSK